MHTELRVLQTRTWHLYDDWSKCTFQLKAIFSHPLSLSMTNLNQFQYVSDIICLVTNVKLRRIWVRCHETDKSSIITQKDDFEILSLVYIHLKNKNNIPIIYLKYFHNVWMPFKVKRRMTINKFNFVCVLFFSFLQNQNTNTNVCPHTWLSFIS